MFLAAAEAETVHAIAHLRALKGVGDTADNLKEAVEGETFEYKDMYPGMIETAKEEGNKAAERSFDFAKPGGKDPRRAVRKGFGQPKAGRGRIRLLRVPGVRLHL